MKETAMSSNATVSQDISTEFVEAFCGFFEHIGALQTIKPEHNVEDSFSNLIGGLIKVNSIQRGKISCLLTVKAPIVNVFGGMHGGAVAAVAERVAIACARTVVGKDKDIFLGELSISFLSAAPPNECFNVIQLPTSYFPAKKVEDSGLKGPKRVAKMTPAELVVDGSVARSGRNLTVVTVDFRLKESGRLAYMTLSTFFNMPVSRL